MLQAVLDKVKSADEKLRSLGKVQGNQSATIDQSQNFTFVRHLQQPPPSLQQLQRQQQERQRRKEKEEEEEEEEEKEEEEDDEIHLIVQKQLKAAAAAVKEPPERRNIHGKFVSKQVAADVSHYDNIPARSSSNQRLKQNQQQQQKQLRARFLETSTSDNAIGSPEVNIKGNSNSVRTFQKSGSSDNNNMAERAIARNSRRERNKTNVHRVTEEIDKAEARRRSRSEGPSRRLRQSMDVREGGGGGSGKGQGPVRDDMRNVNNGQYRPNSDTEDEIFHHPGKQREQSDSDSDRQKWMKNPLVVRRVKKSEKTRSLEKRHSAADMSGGGGSSHRNSLVTSSRGTLDEKGSSGGDNSGSREGTGSRSSQKFQKLEEMRKKRINMSVTSDEENTTPASRISRLRQRAIQGGLGDQPRPLSTQGFSRAAMGSSRNDGLEFHQQSPKVAISPYSGNTTQIQQIQNQFPGSNRYSMSNVQQQQHQQQQQQQQQRQQRNVTNINAPPPNRTVFQKTNPQTTTNQTNEKPGSPYNIQQSPVQKPTVAPSSYQSGIQINHPSSFNTIPDHHSHISRALYNSSPEVNKRQFMPQARIPSADSIHDAPQFPPAQQKTNQFSQRGVKSNTQSPLLSSQHRQLSSNQHPQRQHQQIIHHPHHIQQQQQQQLQQQQQTKPLSYSFQELRASRNTNPNPISMRLQSTSSSHEEPIATQRQQQQQQQEQQQQHKIPKSSIPHMMSSNQYSEDSLDELIESNIQYLDREIDKAKAKRLSNIPTTKQQSAVLSNARNNNGTFPYTNITKSSSSSNYKPMHSNIQQQEKPPVLQVPQNSSVQFHVSLGNKPQNTSSQTHLAPPAIHIARSASDRFDDTQDFKQATQYRHNLQQPDIVPLSERKYSYETARLLQRPGNDHYDWDDLSKSDSQLNAPYLETVPYIPGKSLLHPDPSYARGCSSDINLASTGSNNLEVPLMEKGMFSDVDYDIEVSERVKKWEKYMKKPINADGSRKTANLSAIQERQEGDQLMLPSEIRKSVLLSKKGGFVNPHNQDLSSSATNLSTGEPNSPNVLSIETNAKRFFHVIQEPQAGPKLELQSQSMSSVLQAPINIKLDRSCSSSINDLGQHFFPNQLSSSLGSNSHAPIKAIHAHPVQQAIGYNNNAFSAPQSQDEGTPVMMRSNRLTVLSKPEDRSSKYQEELEEISNVKDSVNNLRRRFDPDSVTMTSEDDRGSVVSTASANLSRPAKYSPNTKDPEPVDWSSMIPGIESRIKESDVWSPNLESTTAGVAVSIERVKARTLQTIPFSEDPFWKEIEKMTSFDPNSESDHYSTAASGLEDGVIKPHHAELTASSHSSTLPSQPRHTMSSKDRLQRSKSLYTPNITPLTINVDKSKVSSSNALDEVLDDIRTSMERQQQLSPKKRSLEKNTWSSIAQTSNEPYKMNSGKVTFINQPQIPPPNNQSIEAKKLESGSILQMRAEQPVLPNKQPLQFYQQQRNQILLETQKPQQQQQNRLSQQMNSGNVNGYQLDPDLLKQKLLKTGLVVETDTEEPTPPPRLPVKSSSREFFFPTTANNSDQIPQQLPAPTSQPLHPIQTQSSLSAPQSRKESFLSKSGVQSGSNALDDIQRALASFKSSSYQPGPDSLYGTSELEAFSSLGMDTTRGPNTEPTSWTYQPQTQPQQTTKSTQDFIRPIQAPNQNQSSNKLQQVNRSMDDLKELAQSVESRINSIKNRLHSADETSLDTILSSLRKFSPDSKFSQETPASFDDYYNRKKTKLSSALSELDRIHSSLDLKQNPQEMSVSSSMIPPQPKSEHLRPMQMRISSMYISGLQPNTESEIVDKEVDNEFDVISKSFQAIIDEVNKTSNVLSRSNSNLSDNIKDTKPLQDERQPLNVAPETQKKTFTITLQGNNSKTQQHEILADNNSTAPKSPPQTAPKPQIVKPKTGRFRSKLQDHSSILDEPDTAKGRSKSVPELDFGTPFHKPESTTTTTDISQPEDAASSGKVKGLSVGTNIPTSTSTTFTPPPVRARARMRPVKDNKIIQDDRAFRKERVLGMPPSPQPSPKLTRRPVVFPNNNNNNNNSDNLDVKIDPPTMFQDAKEEDKTEPPKYEKVEETAIVQVPASSEPDETETKFTPENKSQSSVPTLAPDENHQESKSKTTETVPVPSPVVKTLAAASSSNISSHVQQSQIPVAASKTSSMSLEKHTTPSSPGASRAKLKVNLVKAKENKSGSSSVNMSPTSAGEIKKLAASSLSDTKEADTKEKQTSNSNASPALKGKRSVGSGVALMMDKFKQSDNEESNKIKSPKPIRSGIPKEISKSTETTTNNNNKDKSIASTSTSSLSEKKTKPTMKYSLAKRSGSPKPHNEEKENSKSTKSSLNKIQFISNQDKKLLSGPNSSDKPCHSQDSASSTVSSPVTKAPPDSATKPSNVTSSSSSPSTRTKSNHKGAKESSDGVLSWHKTYETPKATVKSIQLKPSGGEKTGQGVNNSQASASATSPAPERKTVIQPTETKVRRGLPSPKVVRRRVRPTHRKIQTESLSSNPGSSGDESFKQRPHSFHELVSNFPGSGSEMRKYVSAEGLILESPENPTFKFRSEQVTINASS